MSNTSNTIMAAGLVDEGLQFEAMEAELTKLKKLISSGEPVCPICLHKMEQVNLITYYDNFSFWRCNCDDFPDAEPSYGAYA